MVFSRFIWTSLLFVCTIVVTSVLLGIYLQKPEFPVTRSLLIFLLAIESGSLIVYLIRIRKDLLKLVNALRNEDPTMQFSEKGKDPYFSAIHHGFNEIIRNFRLVRLDKEAEQRFFEATVNHVGFGLIAFNGDGQVKMVNAAFLRLFELDSIQEIEALEKVEESVPGILKQLNHQQELLRRIIIGGIPHHLIFLASRFKLKREEITLISIRDISREIDRNELEAWQKLLRVLRHEILNSLTPIRLISSNLAERIKMEEGPLSEEFLKPEEIETLRSGLETIHRRSSSLSNFLDAYSNLYRVPELNLEAVPVRPLLERTGALFREQMDKEGISFKVDCPPEEPVINLDERLIEQVLINLLKNAFAAVSSSKEKRIIMMAEVTDRDQVIRVKDTGTGIPEELRESIFIPFYSTRPDGNGIGLSFAQHIMRLHQGYVHVITREGHGSEFGLHFGTIRNGS
ncbi:MAG: sensor histidine kinase [Bacteroidales bacterium]